VVNLELESEHPERISHYELFLDGVRSNVNPREGVVHFDAASLSEGYHELRIVAIAAGSIESQSRRIIPFVVDVHGGLIDFSVDQTQVSPQGTISVTATASTPGEIAVELNGRRVGTIPRSGETASISAADLGTGTCRLMATAPIDGKRVQSLPVTILIQ
jgi:hypothetical protein